MKKWMKLFSFVLIIILVVVGFTVNNERFFATDSKGNTQQSRVNIDSHDETGEKYKVLIDPGHGGTDPGSIGASGSYEKDFTLELAMRLNELLEGIPEIEVDLTREEDVFLSAETRERTNYANEIDADVYISLHANTFEDPSVSGTETYYYDNDSIPLANVIHRHVTEATGFDNRGVKKEDYFVLNDTNMPATLVELGYITNPKDEQTMLTDEFQQSVANAIKDGIEEYLEID